MKLKTLLIVVVILGLASLGAYFAGRPPKPMAADPRVGQPLVANAVFEQAATVTINESGKSVVLKKGDNNTWRVANYYDFPADFSKLSRLVSDLTGAKIERLVSQNAEKIKGFEFKDTGVTVADANGKELWSLKLGKNAEGGGRLIRFGEENKAFLTRLNAYLDAEPKSWADSSVITVKSDDVAKVELSFPDGAAPVVASRAKKEDPFTATDAPSGQRLKTDRITSLLSSLSSVRFSDTTEPTDANAAAAKSHARTVKLTLFSGKTLTLELGRKPEQKVVKAPEAKKDGSTGPAALGNLGDLAKAAESTSAEGTKAGGEGKADDKSGPAKVLEPVTETIPAGPVFVFASSSDDQAEINGLMKKRAFQVYEGTYTGLPQTRAELFEAAPAPAPTTAPAPSSK